MVKVKICGISNIDDAVMCFENGADYLGFIFIKGTPRYLGENDVFSIISAMPAEMRNKVSLAGLFKDEDPDKVCETADVCGLDMVQLQGCETPDECSLIQRKTKRKVAKALRITEDGTLKGDHSPLDYRECDYLVMDTFHPSMAGGTGMSFDWDKFSLNNPDIGKPFFVAGGLTPVNVASAVRALRPYGVDVSSGVESSVGKKDIRLIREFIKNAKT